jgi:F-type H+-transporting ATPase subunit delta
MNSNQPEELADHPHTVDVTAQRVARVYAEALLKSAQKQNAADEVLEDLQGLVQDVFQKQPLFEVFLGSYAIGRKHKTAVLQSAFKDRINPIFFNFLMVLNAHDRLELLRPIRAAYRELNDQRARRFRVEVRSAVPLPEDQRHRLSQELRETFRLEPILEEKVAPDLLGGMTVRVGDWLYDASVRTQLDTLCNQLITRSSHEIQSGRDRFSTPIGN